MGRGLLTACCSLLPIPCSLSVPIRVHPWLLLATLIFAWPVSANKAMSGILTAKRVAPAVAAQPARANVGFVEDAKMRIDGDLSDWPKDAAPLDAGSSADPKDLSAVAYAAVSTTSFYFACRVTDDKHYQRDYGDRMWAADSVQMAFDPLNQRTRGRYGDYDHEFGLCSVDGAPLVWRWQHPACLKGEKVPGADLAVRFGKGEAVYEARIPLEQLWPLRPEISPTCGFAFLVNDSDGKGDRQYVSWATGIGEGKNPSSFGALVFPTERLCRDVPLAARFILPEAPTPSDKPQEWRLDVCARRAGKLTVRCEGQIERGAEAGSSFWSETALDAPAGVSSWRVRADLSRVAPARVKLRPRLTSGNASDAVLSPEFTVFVYRPSPTNDR